jgi:cobalt-zinc-cadmium efflux system outer membrane protein
LNELMGLEPGTPWQLAAALPALPGAEDPLDASLRLAFARRADLDSDRRAVALLEDALGLARSYRYLGEVEVGAQYERDTDRNRLIGPSLSLQLPIFNQGQAAILRAEALLDGARAQVRARELEIANAVQAAHDRVAAARARVERLANETIPLREQIVARTQEQANYMLVGAFDLLRAKQDEYAAYQQFLEAERDYWRARVDLAHAVGGALPVDLPSPSPTPDAAPAAAPVPSTQPEHDHHGGQR